MSYLRVTRAQFDPAAAETIEPLNAELLSAMRQIPGCQQFYTAIDRAAGRSIAVSVFDTREHAEVPRAQLGLIVGRLQEQGLRMEAPEIYEILD